MCRDSVHNKSCKHDATCGVLTLKSTCTTTCILKAQGTAVSTWVCALICTCWCACAIVWHSAAGMVNRNHWQEHPCPLQSMCMQEQPAQRSTHSQTKRPIRVISAPTQPCTMQYGIDERAKTGNGYMINNSQYKMGMQPCTCCRRKLMHGPQGGFCWSASTQSCHKGVSTAVHQKGHNKSGIGTARIW